MAIIAVLVAIAIPIFTTQLEKSSQATDAANCRAAYAEAMTAALDSADNTGSATADAVMQSAKWDKLADGTKIGTSDPDDISKTKGKAMTCTVDASGDGDPSVTWAAAN